MNDDELCGGQKEKYLKGSRLQKLKNFYSVVGDAKLSRHIERAIYNSVSEVMKRACIEPAWSHPTFTSTYDMRCFERYQALNPKSDAYNSNLLIQLNSGSLTPLNFAEYEAKNLNPERIAEVEIIKIKSRGTKSVEIEGSTHLKCKRCGESKTRTSSLHNRGLDEGVSKIVHCLNCGNSWSED